MHDGEGLPFDRWAADIEHLQVQHGAFTIQAQNATQLDLSFEKDDRPLSVELGRSEEHTSELQSRGHLVCRLLLEKKKSYGRTSSSRRPPCTYAARGRFSG